MRQLLPQSWPAALIEKRRSQSRLIADIFPDSPAAELGLQPGWEILQIDAETPTADRLTQARLQGMRSLHLLDPETNEVWGLEAGPFPLGLKTLPALNADFLQDVAAKRVGFVDLHRIWNHGNWKDFAKLTKSLEIAVLPFGTALLGPLVGAATRQKKILASKDITHLHLLALCYFAEGKKDLSRAAQQAVQTQADAQGGNMPSQYFALNIFLDALHAFATGDAAQAMRLAENGALQFPDQIGLARLFAALSAQSGISVVSRHLGHAFPHAYRLPCRDPFAQWPSGPDVALTDMLDQMQPDQMLLVYALGPYRTNGPFQDDLRGLLPLYAHAPDRIAAVHLITSHDDRPSTWRDNNQIEDQARAMGLPLHVLHDTPGSVEQALQLSSSPSLFVLDHGGHVLATEGMSEEDGYWLALQCMARQ